MPNCPPFVPIRFISFRFVSFRCLCPKYNILPIYTYILPKVILNSQHNSQNVSIPPTPSTLSPLHSRSLQPDSKKNSLSLFYPPIHPSTYPSIHPSTHPPSPPPSVISQAQKDRTAHPFPHPVYNIKTREGHVIEPAL